GF
ncbi:hypothetical protein D020_1574B, partial [Vibrio parahaemolyticus SBR10290]